MSNGGRGSGTDLSETFQNFLDGAARLVAGLGGLATLIAVAFLTLICFKLGGTGSDIKPEDAANTISILQKVLMVGSLGLVIGTTYLFWGSEFLGVAQIAVAAALFFAPMYLPGIVGSGSGAGAGVLGDAMGALQTAGIWFGVIAILVLVADVITRVNQRVKKGTKADNLKYGKGIREEKGRQNTLLGKCWQLPFCREFVRERCPIYHAKTTCWKELVGCMCEEQVIRNAMENKPIPKDMLLAAKMIPRNSRLTEPQKKERCRNCVIYNEHQRHKYKVAMPVTVGAFLLVYLALHNPLIGAMNQLVDTINRVVQHATLASGGKAYTAPTFFVETLLAVFFIVALTYAMKMLEFFIFRAKL